MNKERPKLALVPPPPAMRMDVPMTRTWRDGSSLTINPDGSILLVEAQAQYKIGSTVPRLSLVVSKASKHQRKRDENPAMDGLRPPSQAGEDGPN